MRTRLLLLGAGLVMALVAFLPGVAQAQTCYTGCTTPNVPSTPSGPAAHTTSSTFDPNAHGGLPFTGLDVAGMSIVALGALGAGTALVYRSRRAAT